MSQPIQHNAGQRRFFIIINLILFIWITLPYVVAVGGDNNDYVFGGFLLNPLDGNSYLAKMYEGYRGEWRFTLPYTAEKSKGAFLYLYYILLGHLGRELNLPLVLIYHLARLFGAGVMVVALWRFWGRFFPETNLRRLAFLISTFGLGIGWLAVPLGTITSDFWVAEAYPFLSAFTNPHFPLALGILLFILMVDDQVRGFWYWLSAVLLALLSPFGVVLALLVLTSLAIWDVAPRFIHPLQNRLFRRMIWTFLGGIPILGYQVWAVSTDPLLSGWNEQNITPAPPIWDLALSLSPWLWLGMIGLWVGVRKGSLYQRLLALWLLISLVLVYLPWGLQRRMMMGIYIPVVGLALSGLRTWVLNTRRLWVIMVGLLFLVIPTQLLILLAMFHGMSTHDPQIFLTNDEVAAYNWIESNTPQDALILASPQSGMFIPAHTGRRVVYGHPFETVNAGANRNLVEGFFKGKQGANQDTLLAEVDYILYGPREVQLGSGVDLERFSIVYRNKRVRVYSVR